MTMSQDAVTDISDTSMENWYMISKYPSIVPAA